MMKSFFHNNATREKKSCFSQYSLKEKVGSGAYSVVFRSIHTSDDAEVALKIVNRTSIRLEERDSIARESLILKDIHHQFILPLKEIYEEAHETVLISDWIVGGDILSYVRKSHSYKEADCIRWIGDLLSGVAHLHRLGVFIRGLKPESILMRGNDIVIADIAFTNHLINTDVKFCVSSSYSPPEGFHVSTPKRMNEASSDIWALGVLFYVLISGKHPFVDMTKLDRDPETLHQSMRTNILEGRVKFSDSVWRESPALAMVASMLDIDPLKRPSANQLLEDNQVWLDRVKTESVVELSESLEQLKLWQSGKRFKYDQHGSQVAARFGLSQQPYFSPISSFSSNSPANESLADWLKKAEFSLSLAPGFLGSYAQIGALRAISEIVELSPGENVFAICGTSAGALTGGFIAKGLTLEQMEKEMFALKRQDIWDPGVPSLSTPSLLQGKKMRSCISQRLSETDKMPTFEDCLCPFSVSTWHLGKFEKHVVSQGCLSSAIAASAAVPLLFAPVTFGDEKHTLVDGALGDPTGLGCCTAIPASGRVLHIGFPGEVPGLRGVGCPSLLDPSLVPSSACIDLVSVVLEQSPTVNIFKMQEEGPKVSSLAYESIKAVLQQPMPAPVIVQATERRCQSILRVIRALPPPNQDSGFINWLQKRVASVFARVPYLPKVSTEAENTEALRSDVEAVPNKRQRTAE